MLPLKKILQVAHSATLGFFNGGNKQRAELETIHKLRGQEENIHGQKKCQFLSMFRVKTCPRTCIHGQKLTIFCPRSL